MERMTNDQLWTLWELYTVLEQPMPIDLEIEMGVRGLGLQ
tara:strand:- start:2129 stop:2248 length:120 start_codon:yes stop_codon:yes gene_type:complete